MKWDDPISGTGRAARSYCTTLDHRDEKKDTYHLGERSYGSFERSFRLPDSADEEKIDEGTDTALTLPLEPSAIETASANGKARLQHGVLNFFAAMLRRVPVRRPVRRSWRYVIGEAKIRLETVQDQFDRDSKKRRFPADEPPLTSTLVGIFFELITAVRE